MKEPPFGMDPVKPNAHPFHHFSQVVDAAIGKFLPQNIRP